MKNKDLLKKIALPLCVIVIPVLLACAYYFYFAMDRYVSRAEVVVRRAEDNSASAPGLALLLGTSNPTSREETIYLREYIASTDMLKFLEDSVQWRSAFNKQTSDPFYWLAEDAPEEDVLTYYRKLVRPHFDEITGLLTVEVQSFDPQFSRLVLGRVLEQSERFVNEISHRMARDQMDFARLELANARNDYQEKRRLMLDFQSKNNLLDAQASAQSRATIIAELESEITKASARLKSLRSSLSNQAPQVLEQRMAIAALTEQLEAEKRILLSSPDGSMLNVQAVRYRNLAIDAGIAEEAYKLSVTAVENSRIEASKKIRSLVVIVSPNTPESAIYPRRAYNLFTTLLAALLCFGIVRFILATIKDHRD